MIYEQNHYIQIIALWNIFAELDNNKQSIEKSSFAISYMIFALNAIVKIYIHYRHWRQTGLKSGGAEFETYLVKFETYLVNSRLMQ